MVAYVCWHASFLAQMHIPLQLQHVFDFHVGRQSSVRDVKVREDDFYTKLSQEDTFLAQSCVSLLS